MSAFKTWLNGLTSKTTPVDADEMYLRDSVGAASNKVTWANLKATLLTYFDTAYLKLTGGTLSGGTVTASTPVLTVNQTWNNAGTTFVGKVTNITNAASASNSLIEEWTYDGVARFRIHSNGAVSFGASYTSLTQTPDQTGLMCVRWDGFNGLVSLNANSLYASTEIGFRAGGQWGGVTNTPDAVLARDAANTLAQRNGTNAQAARTYGTYTDASNYRRVAIAMTTAGVASITPEGAGTGASGNVLHISGLPTSNPGAGILWNDSGTVKVGT